MRSKTFIFLLLASTGWAQIQLTGSKSGNDVVWAWNSLGNLMTLSRDTIPQFAHPITLLRDTSDISYTYTGAVVNGKAFESFLVFDRVEDSGYYDALPPEPPAITSVAPSAIKIGDVMTIAGTGFSAIPEENVIAFENGEWLLADTATAIEVTGTVPPGAVSGKIAVCVGGYCSDPVYNLDIGEAWNNPRSIYYVGATDEYYFAGNHPAGNRVKSYKYSDVTKKWEGTERQTAANAYICAQGTDSAGRYHCGRAAGITGYHTEVLDTTNPASKLADCFTVGAGTYKVYGLATDPVLNFTYAVAATTDQSVKAIRKLNSDCSSPMPDMDFGNYGNTLSLNTYATPAVDKDSFVYMPEIISITRINPSTEARSTYATGFSNLFGLAYSSLAAADKGFLLAWEWSPGRLKGMDMNPASPSVFTVYQTTNNIRSATFGYEKHQNQGPANTRVVVFEEQGRPRVIKSPPIAIFPEIELNQETLKVWTGKYNPADAWANDWQTGDAKAKVTIRMTDNVARTFYARIVDPKDTAPYAPDPGTPLFTCDQTIPGNACDNKDPATFSSYGPGTFTANGLSTYLITTPTTQIDLEFELTARYAGDNYQIEILSANADPADLNAKVLVRSPVFTAWKRISIEKDRMFRQGGLIAGDPSPGSTSVLVHDWANLPACGETPGSTPCFQIVVFDATDDAHSAEGSKDRPYVSHVVPYFPNLKQVWLVHQDMSPYGLQSNYYDSNYPLFNDSMPAYSAGIGVIGSGYYEASMAGLDQAFDDAFVSFKYFSDGSGAVPYMPMAFFDGPFQNRFSFAQIWFKNRNQSLPGYENSPSNYWHIVGASYKTEYAGDSWPDSNTAFIYVGFIESAGYCHFLGPPERSCTSAEIAWHIQETTAHEMMHLFGYYADEQDTDWAWCGDPSDLKCDHPDGAPPNTGYTGQYCIMSPRLDTELDKGLAMRTDGVHHLDCVLLSGIACHGEPTGRSAVRTQPDPQ